MSQQTLTLSATLSGPSTGMQGTIQIAGGIEGNVLLDQGDPGTESATASASVASFAVTLGPNPQAITFTSTPPYPAYYGNSYSVSATGGGSGNPVAFSSATTSVCTVTGGLVSFVGLGTCTIDANQAGTDQYAPAPTASQSVTVEPAPTTTTLTFNGSVTYGTESTVDFVVHVTTPSGITVSGSSIQVNLGRATLCTSNLDSTGSGSCTLYNFQLDAGSYSIDAVFIPIPGGDFSGSESSPQTLTVNQAATTLTAYPATWTQDVNGWTATLSAKLVSSASGLGIPDQSIHFFMSGPASFQEVTEVTDSQGVATATMQGSLPEPLEGGNQYQVSYDGTNDYLGSSATGTVSPAT